MKSPLRLAHASDIHLDTDYFGGPENIASRDVCRAVFAKLLDEITRQQPDLFLLPGDLFDSNRASDETIQWAMDKLAALPYPVVMIPGNHDCLEEGSIYHRFDFDSLPNVDMLSDEAGEMRELPELGVRVWGKGMVAHTPKFRPLDGIPAPSEDWWNVGMGHGIYVARGGATFRSSPVEAKQIHDSGYHYIALGHHHALLDVSANGTAAFYSGAPVPISREDDGTFLTIDLVAGRSPHINIRSVD
jgi:DNA repair exonuclease SbcCD nuclease subunit